MTTKQTTTIPARFLDRLQEYGFDTYEEFDEALSAHKSDYRNGNPAVYCGTYYKYNCGILDGMWVDITSFSDFEDFENFCKAIHFNEPDPELMFQDFENFPRAYYSEGGFDEEDFDRILEYAEYCDKYDEDAVDAYVDNISTNLDGFEDAYCGQFDREVDFAEMLIDDCYDLDKMMGELSYYFDYDKFARDLFASDYDFIDGYVFRRC